MGISLPIQALSNLTIIEYSCGVAGAVCSKAFADLGAEVIKVEPIEGDPSRRFGPFPGDTFNIETSGRFIYLNANKKSIALNLRNEQDYQNFQALLSTADAFITDLSPTELARLKIDYETLETAHPELVAVYTTPFGLTGPYRNYKGTDLVIYHMGGLGYETPWFSVTDLENEYPLRAGGYQSEQITGWTTALASMIAIFYKNKYGHGQMVDVSAMECVADHIRTNFATYSHEISQLPESRLKAHFPWIWKCTDGYISTSFSLQHWWDALRNLMGEPNWIAEGGYSDVNDLVAGADDIGPKIAKWMRKYTRGQLFEMLQSKGIPCFPVHSSGEVINSPHYLERGFFVYQKHPVAGIFLQPGPPVRMSETPWSLNSPAPLLGQHNQEILNSLNPDQNQTAINTDSQYSVGERNKPLQGIRILDFGWILSVPHATQWLGTMGAEVLRVESQAHLEPARSSDKAKTDGVQGVNRSGGWNNNNYSKLGITLNLKDSRAIKIIKELVRECDIVVENFAPGVMERLGLGFEDLRVVKPDLIYMSGSTLGSSGPDYKATGWGPNTLSYAGLTSLMGYDDGAPVQAGGNLPDYLVGNVMAFYLLSALAFRSKTGIGQYIEVSMAELVSTLIPEEFMDFSMNRREGKRQGNHVNEMSPHNVYPSEGYDQWIAISIQSDLEWVTLCEVTGHSEWAKNPRFSTLKNRKSNEEELDKLIGNWTSTISPRDAMDLLQGVGIAAGPVMSTFDLLVDPHFNERGFVIELDHPEVGTRSLAGLPAKFSEMPALGYFPAPVLGQDNEYVFKKILGMSADKFQSLIIDKVIY